VTGLSTGVRLMIGSAFSFSLMSLFVKLVGRTLPSQEIVVVRGLVTLTLSYAALKAAGIDVGGDRKGLLWLRGLLGFGAVSAFFYGVIHLPLADATVIHYTNPVFTAAIAAVFLAEPIRAKDAVCLVASLSGVLLIARPTFLFGGASSSLDPRGIAAALTGAILSAGAYATIRRLSRTEHPLVIVLWFGVVTTLGALPATTASFVMPTGWAWLGLAGVGLTTHAGQILLTRGLALEPAGRAMMVSYVQIVFAALWGILFFAERPDGWLAVGATLILGSTVALGRRKPPAGRVEGVT
jgi:drug/metabolite transporter (DMT)-like permease